MKAEPLKPASASSSRVLRRSRRPTILDTVGGRCHDESMNLARVVQLLRELADVIEEGASAEAVAGAAAKPKPKVKKRKSTPRARSFPAPLGPVSETDRARAREMLRKRGIIT